MIRIGEDDGLEGQALGDREGAPLGPEDLGRAVRGLRRRLVLGLSPFLQADVRDDRFGAGGLAQVAQDRASPAERDRGHRRRRGAAHRQFRDERPRIEGGRQIGIPPGRLAPKRPAEDEDERRALVPQLAKLIDEFEALLAGLADHRGLPDPVVAPFAPLQRHEIPRRTLLPVDDDEEAARPQIAPQISQHLPGLGEMVEGVMHVSEIEAAVRHPGFLRLPEHRRDVREPFLPGAVPHGLDPLRIDLLGENRSPRPDNAREVNRILPVAATDVGDAGSLPDAQARA